MRYDQFLAKQMAYSSSELSNACRQGNDDSAKITPRIISPQQQKSPAWMIFCDRLKISIAKIFLIGRATLRIAGRHKRLLRHFYFCKNPVASLQVRHVVKYRPEHVKIWLYKFLPTHHHES